MPATETDSPIDVFQGANTHAHLIRPSGRPDRRDGLGRRPHRAAAYADGGGISFSVIKAGIVIGGSAGSGTLTFHGRQYPLGIGGLSYGFTFGASETHFRGTVSHISGPGDVSGVYAAGNVGAALGRGAQAIVLTNQHGAVLELTGSSVGAIVSADLNGLVITVK